MLAPQTITKTLELLWQEDATAFAVVREGAALTADGLAVGRPVTADLGLTGGTVEARKLDVSQLVQLASGPPAALELGGSAQALIAVVELARRSVAEGLVHPHLDHGEGWWYAFWGATLDPSVQATLGEIAAAMPRAGAAAFEGDADAVVHDLYPVVVDQIARDRLRAAGIRLARPSRRSGASALELFLEGLTAADPALPRHSGYAALERRLSRWVDDGLGRLTSSRWTLGLHLDERDEAVGGIVL